MHELAKEERKGGGIGIYLNAQYIDIKFSWEGSSRVDQKHFVVACSKVTHLVKFGCNDMEYDSVVQ